MTELYELPKFYPALWQRLASHPLAHALLFYGLQGLGKFEFARTLAIALLCEAPKADHLPCGECASCQLIAAGYHPDLKIIEPEGASRIIKIDTIRDLEDFSRQTAHGQRARVIILKEADRLNQASGNALLKILEEPGEHTYFFLITHDMASMMPTIVSRCQKVWFEIPDSKIALAWLTEKNTASAEVLLRLAQGAPFRAQAFSESGFLEQREKFFEDLQSVLEKRKSISAFSESFAKEKSELCIDLLLSVVEDLIKLPLEPHSVVNQDKIAVLKLLPLKNQAAHFKCYDSLIHARQKMRSPVSFNVTLLLEAMMIELTKEKS